MSNNNNKIVKFLYENGENVEKIAKKLNISKSAVYKILRIDRIKNYRTNADNALYSSDKYIAWRNAVLERDGYRCVVCGCKNSLKNSLQVDHILAKALYPEKMFDVNNGRTLCSYHHSRTLTYGRKGIRNYIKKKL